MTQERAADSSLNERQHLAVHAAPGPILVLAGAGSGKTRVITNRIAYLIGEHKAAPSSILALTFTNRAASEMRERAERLCGPSVRDATITTFHSACARWLRREGYRLGLTPNYSILDPDDQLVLLKPLCQQLGLPHDAASLRDARRKIEAARYEALTPHALHSRAVTRDAEEFALLFEHYCEVLTRSNALDFGALIASMVSLLAEHADLRASFQARYTHVLVDEFQDTNPAQYALLQGLAPDAGASVMVVGDDDQAIYGWRGASVENMHRFRDERSPLLIALEENYRSTPEILDTAHQIVSALEDRMPKRLFTRSPAGHAPELFVGRDDREEAEFVARRCLQLIRDEGLRPADIAVFYRTNAQSRVLEESLRRAAVSHEVVGGLSFFERREIRDVTAYLRLATNPRDDAAFRRIANLPPRGIGAGTLLQLDELVEGGIAGSLREALPLVLERPQRRLTRRTRAGLQALDELLSELARLAMHARVEALIALVLSDSGYRAWLLEKEPDEAEERLRNISELQNAAADFREESADGDTGTSPVASFLEQVQLRSATDAVDPELGAVHLMTVHTSKGLEFPAVFVTGLEQELFPLIRQTGSDLAEERRLAYVALTRAQRTLFLSCAQQRRLHAQPRRTSPSEFLLGLSPEKLRWAPESATSSLQWGASHFAGPEGPGGIARRADVDEFDQRPWEERFAQDAGDIPSEGVVFDDTYYPEERVAAAGRLVGRQARHKLFGEGEVLQADPAGDRIRLLIDFPGRGRKKVILDYVELL